MFTILGASASVAAAGVFTALPGVADPEFSRQSNNFVLSEEYDLIAASVIGLDVTDARLNVPTINAYARHHLFGLNLAATIADPPKVADYRDFPIKLPNYEQIAFEGTNAAAGANQITVLSWIAPTGSPRNIPRGQQRLVVRATAAAAAVAVSWGSPAPLTFDENLRSGWYSIVGAQCFDAASYATRFILARPFFNAGRKFRPGCVNLNLVTNTPPAFQMGGLGEWGRFHSQEPPQIELFALATAASAQIIFLDLVYLGDAPP